MAKRVKRKVKWLPFIILIVFILLVVLILFLFMSTSIKNIRIKGNTYYSDQEIMRIAKIDKYPSFYFTTSFDLKNKLEKEPLIKSIDVNKKFYHKLVINIHENKVLFFDKNKSKYILASGQEYESEKEFDVPRLINEVNEEEYDKLITQLNKINYKILAKVSEISYVPNNFDKDRFIFYMDDQNAVYLTLSKFTMIDYYNDVIEQLGEHKGILYLDSGNHFKIMK